MNTNEFFFFWCVCADLICVHMEAFTSPSSRALENYFPLAAVEVIDEHQALLGVAVDPVLRVTDLHGETGRRFRQKPLHRCHCYHRVFGYRHVGTFSFCCCVCCCL